jgi:bacteriocin resistance YdeI/OmpD-like protein/uncharacterized protein DUF1801
VDAYIDNAKPFAQPILTRIRELIHQACPDVNESMKWSMPFFEYRGVNLGNAAAFKAHCRFGFWDRNMTEVLRADKALDSGRPAWLKECRSVADLPPDQLLLSWFRQAAEFIDRGEYKSPMAARNKAAKTKKPAIKVPPDFAKALKKSKLATAAFAGFSPSAKRDYLEWITGAKRAETRAERIATATKWISEGKHRHWKYQTK